MTATKKAILRIRTTSIWIMVCVTLTLVSLPASLAGAHGTEVLIEDVPSVKQSYSLSCEYAAASAVTAFWGREVISEDHFIREVPKNPNPHLGFRGNITGTFGGLTDYGVYAEALVPVLEQHGYGATVFYGGADRLRAELSEGHPIVVWMTSGREERAIYRRTDEGQSFKLVPSEHTVVVYGYDDAGVHIMDVGDGGRYYTDWDSFLRRWGYFDQMALLIHPE